MAGSRGWSCWSCSPGPWRARWRWRDVGASALTRYYQAAATAYVAAETCYIEIDAVDAQHEAEILALAKHADKAPAIAARAAWRPRYDRGRKVCDLLLAAADEAKKLAPLVRAGLSVDGGVK